MRAKLLIIKYRFIFWLAEWMGVEELIDFSAYDTLVPHKLKPGFKVERSSEMEGLFKSLVEMLGADDKIIKSNPYYWSEYADGTADIVHLNTTKPVSITVRPGNYHSAGKLSLESFERIHEQNAAHIENLKEQNAMLAERIAKSKELLKKPSDDKPATS